MRDSDYISVARLGRPVGLKGWCRIWMSGATLEKRKMPVEVYGGRDLLNLKSIVIDELRQQGKKRVCHIRGYEDRESLEDIKDFQLFVKKEQLAEPDEDEYYHFELSGMSVVSEKLNEEIGRVVSVYNFPSVDSLEIETTEGRKILVPFNSETVIKVDKKKMKIIINREAVEEVLGL